MRRFVPHLLAVSAFVLLAGCLKSPGTPAAGPVPLLPERPGLVYHDGRVDDAGQIVLVVKQKDVDQWTSAYVLEAPTGETQASVSLTRYNGMLQARADFPGLNAFYEANYPGSTAITDVLASYFKQGVLVDGKASRDGLAQYCSDRGIALKDTGAWLKKMDVAEKTARCSKCNQRFVDCRVARAKGMSMNCESMYHLCQHGGSQTMATLHPTEWPCGAPSN